MAWKEPKARILPHTVLLVEEIAHRAQTRIQRSVRKTRFPFVAPIEDFYEQE